MYIYDIFLVFYFLQEISRWTKHNFSCSIRRGIERIENRLESLSGIKRDIFNWKIELKQEKM